MTTRFAFVLTVVAVCFGSLALAQPTQLPDPPLVNWTAPASWTPPAAEQARQHLMAATGTADNRGVSTQSLPSSPLPFVAVTPCRLYDSRAISPFTGDSTFTTDGQTEQFNFYATSTTPYAANGNPNGCTLPTAGTVGAWSLKFTYRTSSASQGYLTAYPGSLTTRPGIGTILGSSTQQTSGAAIVPAGTDADSTIKVYAQYAANTVVIDYNGYFAATSALYLPYSGSASSPALTDLFTIENTGAGRAMHAIAVSDTALWAESTSGSGVDGRSSTGVGVYGRSTDLYGVWGETSSPSFASVYGSNSVSGGVGVMGMNTFNSNYGHLGGTAGAYGNGSATGVMGESTAGKGVYGKSTSFDGVWGEASAGSKSGVYGFTSSSIGFGVTGRNNGNSNYGYLGGEYGVYGNTSASQAGVFGDNLATSGQVAGVYGRSVSANGQAGGVIGETTDAAGCGGIFVNSGAVVWVWLATTDSGHVYALFTGGDIKTLGTVYGGAKLFIAPHPEDPSKEIVYTSVEAPTADVYFRGTTRLENGLAHIEVPEHFRLTAREGSYMTTLTALASHADLWVEQEDQRGIIVRGSGNVAFHYVVWAERDLYRDQTVVRENVDFTPSALERSGALPTLPERVKAVLVKNGTLNPDGTYNRETAERLGWTIPDAQTERLR